MNQQTRVYKQQNSCTCPPHTHSRARTSIALDLTKRSPHRIHWQVQWNLIIFSTALRGKRFCALNRLYLFVFYQLLRIVIFLIWVIVSPLFSCDCSSKGSQNDSPAYYWVWPVYLVDLRTRPLSSGIFFDIWNTFLALIWNKFIDISLHYNELHDKNIIEYAGNISKKD